MTRGSGTSSALFVGGTVMAALASDLESNTGADLRIECRKARDSAEALEALTGSDAAIAVVDTTMEGLQGAEGWRRVRKAWRRRIIVVCDVGDVACVRAALADGAEDALGLGDPTVTARLRDAISRALARGRSLRPELRLRDLQERWEALDAASGWYLMEIDEDDRITYINRTAPTSLPPERVRGQSVFTFTHPDAHAEVRARLEHVRRSGQEARVEERAHGTLGDDSWFVARCLPVKRDGRVTSILVVTEDVSEQHRVQKLLTNSERRFRALIEKSSDAIVLVDAGGRALYASPATSQVLGFSPEEMVGRDFFSLVHPDNLGTVVDAWNALRKSGGSQVTSRDVRLRHKDGTWRVVRGVGTNLLDDPAVGAVVGNYRDVTAERALEEQLRYAQQWEAIGLLAGGIAHDFNNLLCIIMTAASAAVTSAQRGSPEAVALDDIHQASARAAELTRKLLSLARTQPLAMEYLDAADLVADFASLIRRSLGEDIEVVVSCERPLPIRVDPLQIEQVLLNVCTNARQAMQGRGRVRIECRCRPEGAKNCPADEDRVVEIAVYDDGPGMDEATRRRVFDPFFTTKPQGSGLGLTVSYRIIQRHGGSMAIETEPGRGTVVRVRLPFQEGPGREREVAPALRAPNQTGGVRVLVAEDELPLRRIIRTLLSAQDYEVVEAEDGETAVAAVAADRGGFALVILDVRLPGLSGPAAYGRMLRERADLPVLFITGHAPDSESIPAGASLLLKPFTTEALLHAVQDATRAGSARAKA